MRKNILASLVAIAAVVSTVPLSGCASGDGAGGAADALLIPKDAAQDGAITLGFDAERSDGSTGDGSATGDAGPATDATATGDAHSDTDGMGADAAVPSGPACSNGVDDDADGQTDFPNDRGCSSADDTDETDPPPGTQCNNGIDDDMDGLVDIWDPDCTSPADPTERGDNAASACSNGLDDDADGVTDFPNDPGCRAAGDDDEADPANPPECADGMDNDGDGATDFPNDPGCVGRGDGDEADPDVAPACSNGVDDDGNGATDYPADPGCDSAADPTETGPCGEGREIVDLNAALDADHGYDGDLTGMPAGMVGTCGGAAGGETVFAWRSNGLVDRVTFSTRHARTHVPTVLYVRRTCGAPADMACSRGGADPGAEVTLDHPEPGLYYVVVDTGSPDGAGPFRLSVDEARAPACRNGEDDDGDGRLDLTDPGCAEPNDLDETDPPVAPACANGQDDDGDGFVDYPADPDCVAAGAEREAPLCALDSPTVLVGQAGGSFVLPLQDGNGHAAGGCDVGFGPETVLVLTLDELSNVRVEVGLNGARPPVAMYARNTCNDLQSEFACLPSDRAGALSLAHLAAGTYFVIIEQGFPAPAAPITATVTVESLVRECNDGMDNDGDGALDLLDSGCENDRDDSEGDPPAPPQCANGQDDDGDGLVDYPQDDGCEGAGDTDELSQDRHLSEDFNPDGVGQIYCNAGGDIHFHDYGPMTFPDCDALANRTGTQYYAGTQWQGQPGDGWLGDHDGITATASSPGDDWGVTLILPADMPYTCRLALMPHRTEPDAAAISPESVYTDVSGHRWHYWVLNGQTHSQCLAYADTVRGRIVNPWSVGLGPVPMIASPTHWCHAGPQFNQDGVGINSDQPANCAVAYWE